MIGDGPDRIKAEELSRNLGVFQHVKFLGKLKIIEEMLALSDIFILIPVFICQGQPLFELL